MAKETNLQHPTRGHVAMLYYDVANDRFQVVQGDDVDTAIPAAGKALLASSLGHGYDGSLWRKQALLWGYTDTYSEAVDEDYDSTGFKVLQTALVASGYLYIVTCVSAYFNSGTVTGIKLYLTMGAGDLTVSYDASPAVDVPLILTGSFPLKVDHRVKAGFTVSAQPCHCYLVATGYKMKLDM